MRKKHLLAFVIVIAVGISWWLAKESPQRSRQALETNFPAMMQEPPVPDTSTLTRSAITSAQNTSDTVIIQGVPISKDYLRYAEHVREDPLYDWKQPINFYGKVVDESNQVIAGANVDSTWSSADTLAKNGTLTKHDITDASGLFSIHETGSGIGITVSKEGYYTTPSERLKNFEYANHGNGVFEPDASNPVVFHLRKKGAGVDLIISQNGMSSNLRISPSADGAPVLLDFYSQKVGNAGQLKIEGWKERKDIKTTQNNWGFRLTVPDGGLVEQNDEFPFEAPDTNYLPVVEWHFTNGEANWQGGINKRYYIKFGNPARYGTVTVETGAFSPTVYLGYAINPDGSRNLEPK